MQLLDVVVGDRLELLIDEHDHLVDAVVLAEQRDGGFLRVLGAQFSAEVELLLGEGVDKVVLGEEGAVFHQNLSELLAELLQALLHGAAHLRVAH